MTFEKLDQQHRLPSMRNQVASLPSDDESAYNPYSGPRTYIIKRVPRNESGYRTVSYPTRTSTTVQPSPLPSALRTWGTFACPELGCDRVAELAYTTSDG